MRASESTRSALDGGLPHPNLVPPPRGITAASAVSAARITALTSCSVAGSTTHCGMTPETASSARADRTFALPTTAGSCCSRELTSGVIKSEPLRDTGGLDGVRDILARRFAAKARTRKDLGGIREQQRIEGATDALHSIQVRLAEHTGH